MTLDDYLRANIDLAGRLGCEWVVVHAGYHFSSALAARTAASIERHRAKKPGGAPGAG